MRVDMTRTQLAPSRHAILHANPVGQKCPGSHTVGVPAGLRTETKNESKKMKKGNSCYEHQFAKYGLRSINMDDTTRKRIRCVHNESQCVNTDNKIVKKESILR